MYCTDWQHINSPNWTFQNNNFIPPATEAAILLSHDAPAKPKVFLSMDLIGKSKMAGQVKNGEILSWEFAFYEKITDDDPMLRASNDLKRSQ